MKERFWELIFLRVVNFWQVGVRTVVSGFGRWLVRFSFLMNCPLVYRIKPREKNVLIDSTNKKFIVIPSIDPNCQAIGVVVPRFF